MDYTLSDRVEYDVILPTVSTTDKYIRFAITNIDNKILYVGRLFFEKGTYTQKLDISDILKSIGMTGWYTYDNLIKMNVSNRFVSDDNIVGKDTIKIYQIDDSTGKVDWQTSIISNTDTIFYVYPQKHKSAEDELALIPSSIPMYNGSTFLPMLSDLMYIKKFTTIDESETTSETTVLRPKLLPTIPYGYVPSQLFGNFYYSNHQGGTDLSSVSTITHKEGDYENRGTGGRYNIKDKNYVERITFYRNSGVPIPRPTTYWNIGDVVSILYGNDNNYTLCDLFKVDDECSRFYLTWFDRLGGIQMQPFRKGSKLTVEYDKVNARTKYETEHTIRVNTTDKYEINTGWLDEDILSSYESIFTSPYLALYDTNYGTITPVVVDDNSFEYKTFKNQGLKMFNLKLNLSTADSENIIY